MPEILEFLERGIVLRVQKPGSGIVPATFTF